MSVSVEVFVEQVTKLERRFDWKLPGGSRTIWIEELDGEKITDKDLIEAVRRCLKDPAIRRFPTVNDLIKLSSAVQCERYGQKEQSNKFDRKKAFACGSMPEHIKRKLEAQGNRDIGGLVEDMPAIPSNQPTESDVERKEELDRQAKTLMEG